MQKECRVKIVFGGDFAPILRFEDIAKNGPGIFGNSTDLLQSADYSIINLEAPICDAGTRIRKSGPNIRVGGGVSNCLSHAGVKAVSLANNHIYDYGLTGLEQTIKELERNGIAHFGAGNNRASAEAPLRLPIKGRRFSFFSYAEQEFNLSADGQAGAAILNPLKMAKAILRERQEADAVIVCVHGGNEFFPYPRPGLRDMCRFLIDIGVDAVVGHHPHVPGPYEIYLGKPIIYSLGNLIFDTQVERPGWDKGYLAEINFDFEDTRLEGIDVSIHPYSQKVSIGGVEMLSDDARQSLVNEIEEMRRCLETRPDEWLDHWNAFVAGRKAQSLIDLSSPIRFRGLRRLMNISLMRNLVTPPTRRLQRLNMLRCPSHHELVVHAMQQPYPQAPADHPRQTEPD
ncbi:CapA family protein [Limimaricola soesokkakensis]|uniref:CapA family protein n=1 Tax=Limimaricola soesokkakensis TaxID=1343159 RepID=UPI000A26D5CA|nr:CapA family protein [Limimaricola soesokkakensis]